MKNNGFGFGIYIQLPRMKGPVPLLVVYRALGILSDKDVCNKIVLDIKNEHNQDIVLFMKASLIDSNEILTQEDAIQYITSNVIYTPINMTKEEGFKKKRAPDQDVENRRRHVYILRINNFFFKRAGLFSIFFDKI